ncbi:acyltransferase family protein [Paenibacillus jilunlii]|uniref:Fucose 4-O-acetylase n=1 Tax=Paenibacillus jilunlii TaxID=682956 RepID=A0A1G9RAW2_9BACL|nr:acyltransferase family protein [Paenibacillus jilunlii]SDM20230.1 Fucose 4-O-acetylase [Paenibacillus jilunlii]
MNKQRELWIDAAKGFSIIFVVMGHSGDAAANHYLSWFRMPLFFMLSGLVFKPVDSCRYLGWAAKRTKGLMTPYAAYGMLIATVLLLFSFNLRGFAENIARLLYGGLSLTGPYGVFWFITCLLFTQLLFGFIVRYSMRTQLLLITAAYSLSHLISLTSLHTFNLPWNIDVSLLAVTYYAVGYYGKKAIPALIRHRITLLLLLPLCAGVFALERTGMIHYSLNMKYKEYDALLLDLCIPLLISLTICAAVYGLSRVLPLQRLGNLGRNTIAIMYLHLPVNYALKYLLGADYGLVPFTVTGVGVPLLAAMWISRYPLLSRWYLGHSGASRPAVSYIERSAVSRGFSAGD